jgi:hypothetical protein
MAASVENSFGLLLFSTGVMQKGTRTARVCRAFVAPDRAAGTSWPERRPAGAALSAAIDVSSRPHHINPLLARDTPWRGGCHAATSHCPCGGVRAGPHAALRFGGVALQFRF